MTWRLETYLDSRGRNPVEGFILRLPEGEQAIVRARINFLVEAGNRAREPLSKSVGKGLFELRTKSSRIFYCFKPGGNRSLARIHQKDPEGSA